MCQCLFNGRRQGQGQRHRRVRLHAAYNLLLGLAQGMHFFCEAICYSLRDGERLLDREAEIRDAPFFVW